MQAQGCHALCGTRLDGRVLVASWGVRTVNIGRWLLDGVDGMKARVLLVAAALRRIDTYPPTLPILFNAVRFIWHLVRRRLRKLHTNGQMPSLGRDFALADAADY